MQFGLMLRGNFAREDDMRTRLEEHLEQVRLARDLGFASITKGSHYSTYPFQGFQQLPFLTRVSAEVPRMRVVAGIVLLPLHKPLDLAEQLATIDIISGGKLTVGVGLGYRDVEFKAFGTSKKESLRRFNENLEAIRRLWSEEKVWMRGSHFELDGASCSAKPLQKPHPPIWVGANADEGIRRAGGLGLPWYINPHNRLDTIARQMDLFREALGEAGHAAPEEIPMRREVFVAESREEALRLCGPYLKKKYDSYHEWGQDKAMPEGHNDFGVQLEELIEERFILGSPDEVAGQIAHLAKRLGVNHLIISLQWPGMPHAMALDTMRLLAGEVFPKVWREVGVSKSTEKETG